MQWNELFTKEQKPSDKQINMFVGNPLWDNLTNDLKQTFNIQPELSYSACSMDKGFWKGWNVKYRKSGKALCTLYPKKGHFMALINIGAKESADADSLIPFCTKYIQNLYNQTKSGKSGKSLAIDVTSEKILLDLKKFVALRAQPRK
jgi:AraC family transcriptional regulator